MSFKPTRYVEFHIGSRLSYQLAIFDSDFEIVLCLTSSPSSINDGKELLDFDIPAYQLPVTHESLPTDWGVLTYVERMTLESIFLETIVDTQILERETTGQDKNKLWLTERLKRITSSQAHKVFIRKKNFETLANSFTEEKDITKVCARCHATW